MIIWQSGNMSFIETLAQGVFIIIESGKVQYISKQKETCACPGKSFFFYTISKIGYILKYFKCSKLAKLPDVKKLLNQHQQN